MRGQRSASALRQAADTDPEAGSFAAAEQR